MREENWVNPFLLGFTPQCNRPVFMHARLSPHYHLHKDIVASLQVVHYIKAVLHDRAYLFLSLYSFLYLFCKHRILVMWQKYCRIDGFWPIYWCITTVLSALHQVCQFRLAPIMSYCFSNWQQNIHQNSKQLIWQPISWRLCNITWQSVFLTGHFDNGKAIYVACYPKTASGHCMCCSCVVPWMKMAALNPHNCIQQLNNNTISKVVALQFCKMLADYIWQIRPLLQLIWKALP